VTQLSLRFSNCRTGKAGGVVVAGPAT